MPAFPAFKTKPYYDALKTWLLESHNEDGTLKSAAVAAELAKAETAQQAAADAVATEAAAFDYGPYITDEVQAALAADDTPAQAAALAAETAVDTEVADRDLLENVDSVIVDDAVGGVIFEDGKQTWLTTTEDGAPTTYALAKIRASGVINAASTPSSAYTATAAHPVAFKPLDAPLVTLGEQSAISLYWPNLVDRRAMGGTGVTLLYSTDHAAHADSGIYALDAASPLGPWTDRGRIYLDSTGGTQTETPSAIWDEAAGLYRVFYQQASAVDGAGSQDTILATTPDLATLTRVGSISDYTATDPGDGHTGYFRVFRYRGGWYAFSLYGGGGSPRFAFWHSADGATWQARPGRIGWAQPQIDHLTGYDVTWGWAPHGGDVIEWRGSPWWVGLIGPITSGSGTAEKRICAAPLAPDLCHIAGRAIDITPDAQSWEGGISDIGNALAWNGRVYMVYRGESATSGFGLLEIV